MANLDRDGRRSLRQAGGAAVRMPSPFEETQVGAHDETGIREQQGHPERQLDPVLDLLTSPQGTKQEDAAEATWDRPHT